MKGTHPIHRRLLDHWIWLKEKPFTSGQAFVDLILLANHTDSKAVIEGDIKIIKSGQVYRSQLTLGKRWGWSRKRVFNFLNLLEKDEMLTHQGLQHGTIITLLNYNELRNSAFDKVAPKVAPRVAPTEHQQHTKGSTYNNDKNVKNDNKDKYLEFVYLTKEEYSLLEARFKSHTTPKIEALNDYIGSTGKKYKSHYHTILNWARKDEANAPKRKLTNADFGPIR